MRVNVYSQVALRVTLIAVIPMNNGLQETMRV